MSIAARRRPGRLADPQLSARRRADLIQAATDVFAEIGYTDAGIAEITARAGLGKGTFYQYFDSKKHVLEGVIDTALEQISALITAPAVWADIGSFSDIEKALRKTAEGLFVIRDEHPHAVAVLVEGLQDKDIKRRLLHHSATLESTSALVLRYLAGAGWVRSDLDFEFVAHVLVSMSLGAGILLLRGGLSTSADRARYIESCLCVARELLVSGDGKV